MVQKDCSRSALRAVLVLPVGSTNFTGVVRWQEILKRHPTRPPKYVGGGVSRGYIAVLGFGISSRMKHQSGEEAASLSKFTELPLAGSS